MTGQPAATQQAAKKRDPWLDNAKFIFVAVVVVGHAFINMPYSDARSIAYHWIYFWHVPVFVFITGYLSKSFRYDKRRLISLVTTLVIPYVIFSYLMYWFRVYVGDEAPFSPILTNPRWPMWYLIVLVWWRLLTPLLKLHWVMIPISFAVSILAGLHNFELFDFNRMFGFLPWFTLGLHVTPKLLDLAKTTWARPVGVTLFAFLGWLAFAKHDEWRSEWQFFRAGYESIGLTAAEGMQVRATLLPLAFLGIVAALCLVPRRRSLISAMGAASMVIYLFHGFFIRGAEYAGWAEWMPRGSGWAAVLITAAAALCVAFFLGWPPVANALSWLADPINTFQRYRAQQAKAAAARPVETVSGPPASSTSQTSQPDRAAPTKE